MLTRATDDLAVGLDLGFQILADPSGLHSTTVDLAFIDGRTSRRMLRLGFRYVSDDATGSVIWVTAGMTDVTGER